MRSVRRARRSLLAAAGSLLILAGLLPGALAPVALGVSSNIVISEFRVRGPNGGSDEFIELYNKSASPISIAGWKLRGSNASGSVSTRVTINAGTTLNPGCHFLATNTSTSGGPYSGAVLGDQTYATGVTDDGGIAVTLPDDTVVDAVGMSTGSAFREGDPLGNLGTSNVNWSYERDPGGAAGNGTDTDNNAQDFSLINPSQPQNLAACGGPPSLSINDVSASEGNSGTKTFAFTVTLSAAAGTGGVTFDVATADGTATTANSDYVPQSRTGRTIAAGSSSYAFNVTVNGDTTTEPNETFLVNVTNVVGATVSDAQGLGTITNDDIASTRIHELQGAAHRSTFESQVVATTGIVTAVRNTATTTRGFWVQDPAPDANIATSEAIFVFTGATSSPAALVSVGDAVRVQGTLTEFRGGGASSAALTLTQISGTLTISVASEDNPLPDPVVIGTGGRTPPTQVIDDDAAGSVETSGSFDATTDGIDFFESLEGMRVQLNNAVSVGPQANFGTNREIPVVGDGGVSAAVRTPRGGIIIRPTDFNPERLILNDLLHGGPTIPAVHVGSTFPGATIGVIDYTFNNFKVQVSQLAGVVPNDLPREAAAPATDPDDIIVATFNVENLDANDPQSKFDELADLIVNNLRAPDLLSLEEIQDNNGPVNDGTVSATATLNNLRDAIVAAGGPTYDYRVIDPVNNADGGEPGGNIRVGFFFRTDRGLAFVDRPGGTATTPATVVAGAEGPELSVSPGRVDPTNAAWNSSRKPLVGEFTFHGQRLFAIANHFNSKGGDNPLFGRFQPPALTTAAQRTQQAQAVNTFVDNILAVDPNAAVIVLGDLNDFEFSGPMATLKGTPQVLHPLIETLPESERYTYVFEGNSQSLDHIFVSSRLRGGLFEFDSVHVNAEYANQVSDHDPQVVRITLWQFDGFIAPVDNRPTVNTATAGSSLPLKFSLNGDQGTDVLASGYPTSISFTCGGATPTDAIEEASAPGDSGLQYDSITDTYQFNWRTSRAWANTCRTLVLRLADGSYHFADFQFTR